MTARLSKLKGNFNPDSIFSSDESVLTRFSNVFRTNYNLRFNLRSNEQKNFLISFTGDLVSVLKAEKAFFKGVQPGPKPLFISLKIFLNFFRLHLVQCRNAII